MTRDHAVKILQALFRSQNVDSPGLNEKNLGGAAIGDLQIYFQYQPDDGTLKCSALIYRFREAPRPGVLEGFKREEALGTTGRGGGVVDYQPENNGLYLTRSYLEPVNPTQFMNDIVELMAASRLWGGEVLERVSAQVFNSEE
ncbi:MAG: hypothetical protein AB1489_16505 [Acidobacteriota bacterium]